MYLFESEKYFMDTIAYFDTGRSIFSVFTEESEQSTFREINEVEVKQPQNTVNSGENPNMKILLNSVAIGLAMLTTFLLGFYA